MINKKMLVLSLTAALSITAVNAVAGSLTLKSQHEPDVITVMCGATQSSETDTHLPVPANGQRGPLSFDLISFMFGSNLTCDFYDSSIDRAHDIGTANFLISSDASTATIASFQQYNPSKYSVVISSGSHPNLPIGTAAKNITVLLSGV